MSAGDLKLDYAREARASMDQYLEDVCNSPETTLEEREENNWLLQVVAMSLVSIAANLQRITDEETA